MLSRLVVVATIRISPRVLDRSFVGTVVAVTRSAKARIRFGWTVAWNKQLDWIHKDIHLPSFELFCQRLLVPRKDEPDRELPKLIKTFLIKISKKQTCNSPRVICLRGIRAIVRVFAPLVAMCCTQCLARIDVLLQTLKTNSNCFDKQKSNLFRFAETGEDNWH